MTTGVLAVSFILLVIYSIARFHLLEDEIAYLKDQVESIKRQKESHEDESNYQT